MNSKIEAKELIVGISLITLIVVRSCCWTKNGTRTRSSFVGQCYSAEIECFTSTYFRWCFAVNDTGHGGLFTFPGIH